MKNEVSIVHSPVSYELNYRECVALGESVGPAGGRLGV